MQAILIKGKKFDSWRRVGTVLPAIKIYNSRDVDELLLLDIVANKTFYEPDYDNLNEFTNFCFVPFAFGGGPQRWERPVLAIPKTLGACGCTL